MLAGPTYLKQCPECGKYYSQSTLDSGNTGGATYWTDGKMEAPMLPQYPDIIECVDCSTIFRISKQPKVDTRPNDRPSLKKIRSFFETSEGRVNDILKEHKGNHAGWNEARSLGLYRTSAETFLKCLDTDLLNENGRYTEKKLRILAWRRFNDRFRDRKKSVPIEWTPKFRQNAEKLIEIFDETDTSEAMTKAEIYRELGVFDKSTDLLKDLARNDDSDMIKKILALSEQENSDLVNIKNKF